MVGWALPTSLPCPHQTVGEYPPYRLPQKGRRLLTQLREEAV